VKSVALSSLLANDPGFRVVYHSYNSRQNFIVDLVKLPGQIAFQIFTLNGKFKPYLRFGRFAFSIR